MSFREQLPEDCPPTNAGEVTADLAVYRLVKNAAVAAEDFNSQRADHPEKIFSEELSECVVCGVSVFADRRDCELARKLRSQNGKLIARVVLRPGAGVVLHSPGRSRPSHHTWWPFREYDILASCEVVAE